MLSLLLSYTHNILWIIKVNFCYPSNLVNLHPCETWVEVDNKMEDSNQEPCSQTSADRPKEKVEKWKKWKRKEVKIKETYLTIKNIRLPQHNS